MSSPPGITSQDTSGEAMVFVPTMPLPPKADVALKNAMKANPSVTNQGRAQGLVDVLKYDISIAKPDDPELPLLKKELKQAELLLEFYKGKSTRGLGPSQVVQSSIFPGMKTTAGRKGTRRKNRKHSKWTSSATRKRSSMSASKGRRGKRSMTSSAKSLSSRRK